MSEIAVSLFTGTGAAGNGEQMDLTLSDESIKQLVSDVGEHNVKIGERNGDLTAVALSGWQTFDPVVIPTNDQILAIHSAIDNARQRLVDAQAASIANDRAMITEKFGDRMAELMESNIQAANQIGEPIGVKLVDSKWTYAASLDEKLSAEIESIRSGAVKSRKVKV